MLSKFFQFARNGGHRQHTLVGTREGVKPRRVRSNVPQRRASYHPQVERLEDRLQPSAIFTDGLADPIVGSSLLDGDVDPLASDGLTDSAWLKSHRRDHIAASLDVDLRGGIALPGAAVAAGGSATSAGGGVMNNQSGPPSAAPLASDLLAPQTAAHGLIAAPSMAAPTSLAGQAVVTLRAPVKQLEGGLHLVAAPSSSSEPTISPAFTSGPGILVSSTLISSGPSSLVTSYSGDIETSVKLSKAGPYTGDLIVGGYTTAIPGVGYAAATIRVLDGVSGLPLLDPIYLTGGGGIRINALDQDAAGNIYVAGDSAALGGGSYIAKIDASLGTIDWAVGVGTLGSLLNGLYVNDGPSGSYVYATGSFDSSSFGGHKKDIMAVKMTSGGAVIWDVHDVLPLGESEARGVVVNDVSPLTGPGGVALAGTVYVGGAPKPLLVLLGDADGSLLESWYYSTADLGNASAVTKDASGNLYFTGRYFDHTMEGYNSLLLLKWNPALTEQIWGYVYTAPAIDSLYNAECYGTGIKVDSAGKPYVSGLIDIDRFDGKSPTNCLVAKFTSDGLYGGSHLAYGGTIASHTPPTYDVDTGLDLDGLGNAYAVGFTKSLDFPTTDGGVHSSNIHDGHAEKISGL